MYRSHPRHATDMDRQVVPLSTIKGLSRDLRAAPAAPSHTARRLSSPRSCAVAIRSNRAWSLRHGSPAEFTLRCTALASSPGDCCQSCCHAVPNQRQQWNILCPRNREAPQNGASHDAPERTRTSTDHSVHKALNLARLPIPPQALGAASIAARSVGFGRDRFRPAAWVSFRTHVRRVGREAEQGASGWT